MSSPRGFCDGGIGAMGTDELRFDMRWGDGERRELEGVDGEAGVDGVTGDGEGEVRGNRNAKGLKNSLERSGGWRTFRYMLKCRRALFAWGTYLL